MKAFEGAELRRFYDDRYVEGYMDDWPESKKRRVSHIIRQAKLHQRGRALDLGCGQGVFTRVLRDTLRNWQVVGAEVSPLALKLAADRVPECTFIATDDLASVGPFDFIFTHHVLEHVLDVDETLKQISSVAAPRARMLHILPCGNAGSLEQKLARHVINGIRTEQQNTFFFEDAGHLRRLASSELIACARTNGWAVRGQLFANHFWGAVEWMTALDGGFVRHLTSPSRARTPGAAAALLGWQVSLAGLQVARRVPGSPVGRFLKRRADSEWDRRQHDPAGSEMYLLFERS
jgi:SAM-dependent methyltransferase